MKITVCLMMLLPATADGMMHIVVRRLVHSERVINNHKRTVGPCKSPKIRSFSGGIWYQEGKHEGFNDGYEQARNEAELEKVKQIYALYQELVQKHSEQSPEVFAFLLKKNARTSATHIKGELTRELQLAQEASRSWFSNSGYWKQEIERLEQEIKRVDVFLSQVSESHTRKSDTP